MTIEKDFEEPTPEKRRIKERKMIGVTIELVDGKPRFKGLGKLKNWFAQWRNK